MLVMEKDRANSPQKKPVMALGLMSGTSLDGVDAALLYSDGQEIFDFGPACGRPYPKLLRTRLRAALDDVLEITEAWDLPTEKKERLKQIERDITDFHASITEELLDASGQFIQKHKQKTEDVLIGFHGQTLAHRPDAGWTWQLGDAAYLAKRLKRRVLADFRQNDMQAGGEGAPFAPLYHQALARKASLDMPVAFLNIGGVANITYMDEKNLIAFDTGPGNALIDDWVYRLKAMAFDEGGALAASGRVNQDLLALLLKHDFFNQHPPKSLDRLSFDTRLLDGLSPADGAATLTAFTVEAIKKAENHLPRKPKTWLVAGGGRLNKHMMQSLADRLTGKVAQVDDHGWRGDMIEAELFAFLAIRSLRGLALSLPTTTGCRMPVTGGVLFLPS